MANLDRVGFAEPTILVAAHASYWNGHKTLGVVDSLVSVLRKLGHKVTVRDYPLHASLFVHALNAVKLVSVIMSTRPAIVIGADPLNAAVVSFLRLLRIVPRSIYYSVDYADNRFAFSLLNWVYHAMDHFSCYFSDATWNVSTRITEMRLGRYSGRSERMLLVPNNPIPPLTYSAKENFDGSYVLVSSMRGTIDWDLVLNSFARLKHRFPSAILHIIGDGPDRANIEDQARILDISSSIVMHGALEHSQMFSVILRCSVALAIYCDDKPWTKYGDSTKAREAMALGIPVILTANTSTSLDVKTARAGIVLDAPAQLHDAMAAFFLDPDLMRRLSYNAIQLSDSCNMYSALRPHLDEMLAELALR